MKQLYLYFVAFISIGGFFVGCEKIEPPFYDKNANGVYFDYNTKERLIDTINFANYILQNPTEQTIKLRLKLVGYPADKSRKVILKSKPIEGFPEAIVSIPDVVFDADSVRQQIVINVQRPTDPSRTYAICIFIDADDPLAEIGKGIEGFGEFKIYVQEKYVKPENWDRGVGIYLGDWSPEKQVFMVHVTKDELYAESNDWGEFVKYNVMAVDSLRTYQQFHPNETIAINIPFTMEASYGKPFYWTTAHDKYLGAYVSNTFASLCLSEGVSTLNEKSFFIGDENRMKELNKLAVKRMMDVYDTFFQWGYSGGTYRTSYWVPMLLDTDYPVSKPACWNNPGCAELLERYYGAYSDEKYKFMINTWLKNKGEADFLIVQMFPVINGWGDDGKPLAMWDESLNGENAIKECYNIFKQTYDRNPDAYSFTFPDININE